MGLHVYDDISERIPLQMYTSKHYLPFWLLTLSKFLLFLTNNMITALSTTIYGNNGAYAMTLMYIFFILGNFLAPTLNTLANQNMGLVLFSISWVYTAFSLCAMLVTFSTTSLTSLSPSTIESIFFISSSLCGLAGGGIWVGYGILNIQLGEYIPKKLLEDWMNENLLEIDESYDYIENQLREAVTGKIMSVGWSILSLNTVIGGVLTFLILNYGDTNNSNGDVISKTNNKFNATQLLYIIFVLISLAANFSYFLLYRYYSNEMNTNDTDQKSNHHNNHLIMNNNDNNNDDDNNNNNNNNSIVISSPVFHSITGATSPTLTPDSILDQSIITINQATFSSSQIINEKNSESSPLLRKNYTDTIKQPHNVDSYMACDNNYTNNQNINTRDNEIDPTKPKFSHSLDDGSSQELSQWRICLDLFKSPYVLFSLPEYIFTGCALNFIFAAFIVNSVVPTLGLHNSPLIITMAYLTNTIASFFISDFISTRNAARIAAIWGNVIQLIPLLIPLLVTPTQHVIDKTGIDSDLAAILPTGQCDLWAFALFIAGVAGIGDAIHSASLMTVMASDLKLDQSLNKWDNTTEFFQKEVRGVLYSIYSSTKSIGVFMTFLLAGTFNFGHQCQILLTLGIIAVIGQLLLNKRLSDESVNRCPDSECNTIH